MKISVYGTARGTYSAHVANVARELGKLIALRGHTLITGACEGVPLEAVRGAASAQGEVIGFSPASSLEEHQRWGMPVDGFMEFVFVPESYENAHDQVICRKERNISSVAACDAAIFIAGGAGSLNEFTLAYDFGKPIGVLTETGGIADLLPEIAKVVHRDKPSAAGLVFHTTPSGLLEQLEHAMQRA